MQFPIVVYTHSSYSDVLAPCLGQLHKYNLLDDTTVFTDGETEQRSFKYDDAYSYSDRLRACLTKYQHTTGIDTVLFMHEDFILYNEPDQSLLGDYFIFVSEGEFDYIRLLRTGETGGVQWTEDYPLTKYPKDSEHLWAVQSTIWKIPSLLKVLDMPQKGIWDMEAEGQGFMQDLKLKGAYHFEDEDKRGGAHWDSNVWPCMATGIVKGKWNIREYEEELMPIMSQYGISMYLRGVFV